MKNNLKSQGHVAVLGTSKEGKVFVKYYPKYIKEEYKKAEAVYNISKKSGLFRAPKPITYSEEAKIIIFEYIPGMVHFYKCLPKWNLHFLRKTKKLNNLLYRAGEILAELHKFMHLETMYGNISSKAFQNDLPLSANKWLEFHTDVPIAHLHWDYCLSNIFAINLNNQMPELCVIDASPRLFNRVTPASKGPIYVDIGLFLSGIFMFSFPKYFLPLYKWSNTGLFVNAFLDGYESRHGVQLDRNAVYDFTVSMGKCHIDRILNGRNFKMFVVKTVSQIGLLRVIRIANDGRMNWQSF